MKTCFQFPHDPFVVSIENNRLAVEEAGGRRWPIESYDTYRTTYGDCWIKFHVVPSGEFETSVMPAKVAEAFSDWVSKHNPMFAPNPSCGYVIEIDGAEDLARKLGQFNEDLRKAPLIAVPETCAECYGTGYHKGFGAPCSKGCKS